MAAKGKSINVLVYESLFLVRSVISWHVKCRGNLGHKNKNSSWYSETIQYNPLQNIYFCCMTSDLFVQGQKWHMKQKMCKDTAIQLKL